MDMSSKAVCRACAAEVEAAAPPSFPLPFPTGHGAGQSFHNGIVVLMFADRPLRTALWAGR